MSTQGGDATPEYVVRAFRRFCSGVRLQKHVIVWPAFVEIQPPDRESEYVRYRELLERMMGCELPVVSVHMLRICARFGAHRVETLGQVAASLLMHDDNTFQKALPDAPVND
jgi:hypothetical protein